MSSEHTEWDRIKTLQRFFTHFSWAFAALAAFTAGAAFSMRHLAYPAVVLALLSCHAMTAALAQERFAYYQAQIDMMRLHRGENIS